MAVSNETSAKILHELLPMLLSYSAISPTADSCFSDPSGSLAASLLPEWLRLLLIAAMLDLMRRLSSTILEYIDQAYWVTISFDDEDACYSWILYWLSKHPSWHEARAVQVTTRTFGVPSDGVTTPRQLDRKGAARTLSYMPSTQAKHFMWYSGCFTIIRRQYHLEDYGYRRESLHISLLTRDSSIIGVLLAEAKQLYMNAQNNFVSIYVQDTTYSSRAWRQVAARPKRPLKSIILERGVKENLLHDARQFLESAEWYAERGIPYRRGYLLHGAPGSGKTSLIQSLAGELGLDVYVLTLNRAGLDDATLSQLVAELPRRCIALIEDIDAAFHQGATRRSSEGENAGEGPGSTLVSQGKGENTRDETQCRVSLSGLLNALDGIGAQDGRILFATTNHYGALDPALTRPGRMDLHIEFRLASKDQARELFHRFYAPSQESDDESKMESLVGEERDIKDGGVPISPPPTPTSTGEAVMHNLPVSTVNIAAPDELLQLADQFADAIPDRRMSMAGLQGFLMLHKDRSRALNGVAAWVREQILSRTSAATDRTLETGSSEPVL